MPKWWTFWAVIAAAVALAWLTSAPPQPRPATAPPADFSAARAMATVRDIGRAPHPIGSAEHARVRDAVAARLRALGLRTEILPGAAVRKGRDEWIGADVANVLGVLPGTDPALPAVALMAHYDSVAGSPGAADDGAGVSSILEAVRAIRARGPARRDLIVLITDGEETGLFGATAFWRDNPLARRIGAVVNLETRGSSGPAFMFETGPRNEGVVRLYGDRVARPESSSLNTWVYDHMPNGSDFTVPKTAGVAGVNIAMIGRPFDYHSPTARPENLDPRSLQHMGDQTLAVADGLLRATAEPARGQDLVFADLFGRVLVSYPAWAGWLLLGMAAVLIGLAARAGGLPERRLDIARGAGLFLLLLLWPALAAHAVYRVAPVGPDFYQSPTVAQFGLFFAGNALLAAGVGLVTLLALLKGGRRFLAAVLAVVLGGACSLVGGWDIVGAVIALPTGVLSLLVLGRAVEGRALTLGLLCAALVVTVALQALAPQIAFLFGWPLLAAAAVAALPGLPGPRAPWLAAGALVAALALGWVLRMASPLFDGLGMTNPELLGLFVALAGLLLAPFAAPLAQGRGGVRAAGALTLAGIAVLALVALRDPASPRTPAASHVLHVAEAETGRARLISARERLDPWSRSVLTAGGGAPVSRPMPQLFADQAWTVAAPSIPAPGKAEITLARDGDRVVLTIPARGARDLRLTLTSSVASAGTQVQGQPADGLLALPDTLYRLRWYGPGPSVRIAFRPSAAGRITVAYAALSDGWPAGARPLQPRPADVMATGSSDASVVTGSSTLSW